MNKVVLRYSEIVGFLCKTSKEFYFCTKQCTILIFLSNPSTIFCTIRDSVLLNGQQLNQLGKCAIREYQDVMVPTLLRAVGCELEKGEGSTLESFLLRSHPPYKRALPMSRYTAFCYQQSVCAGHSSKTTE